MAARGRPPSGLKNKLRQSERMILDALTVPKTFGELEGETRLSPSTLTEALEDLEARGMIAREYSPERRRVLITLAKPSDRFGELIQEFNIQLDRPLSAEETKKFRELLSDKLLDALSEIANKYSELPSAIPLPVSPSLTPLDALWFYEAEKKVQPKMVKALIASNVYTVIPWLRNLPKSLVNGEIRKIFKKVDMDELLVEYFYGKPTAEKYGVRAELDNLINFLTRIITVDGRKRAQENRKKAHEIFTHRCGFAIGLSILQRYFAPPSRGEKEKAKGGEKA